MISVGLLSWLTSNPHGDMAARSSSIIPPHPWAVPAVTMPSNHDHSPLSADQSAVVNDSGSNSVVTRMFSSALRPPLAAAPNSRTLPADMPPKKSRPSAGHGAGAETETTESIRSSNNAPHAMALGPPPE